MPVRAFLSSLVILILNMAFLSQARANTFIMVIRTNDEAIVAADSEFSNDAGVPLGRICKIHIANQFIWATSGIEMELRGPFNTRTIAESAVSGGGSLDHVVSRFETELISPLKEALIRAKTNNPQGYLEAVKSHYPVNSVFFQRNDMHVTFFGLPDVNAPDNIEVTHRICTGVASADCPNGE